MLSEDVSKLKESEKTLVDDREDRKKSVFLCFFRLILLKSYRAMHSLDLAIIPFTVYYLELHRGKQQSGSPS